MLYREITAVCSQLHAKHKFTLCAERRIFRRGRAVTKNAYQLRHVHPPSTRKYQLGSH